MLSFLWKHYKPYIYLWLFTLFEYKGIHNSLGTLIKLNSALIACIPADPALILWFVLHSCSSGSILPYVTWLYCTTALHPSRVFLHMITFSGTPGFWPALHCSLENDITLRKIMSISDALICRWLWVLTHFPYFVIPYN